jgi:hypothetical protein
MKPLTKWNNPPPKVTIKIDPYQAPIYKPEEHCLEFQCGYENCYISCYFTVSVLEEMLSQYKFNIRCPAGHLIMLSDKGIKQVIGWLREIKDLPDQEEIRIKAKIKEIDEWLARQ